VSYIKKKIHKDRDTVHIYIVYDEQASSSIQSAVEHLNGVLFEGKHLRVDYANVRKTAFDMKRSIFMGNLPFNVEDEVIWNHFQSCGAIESVRIIRDPTTQYGKGFGYVQFKDIASVGLALQLDGVPLNNRAIRIKRCLNSEKLNQQSSRMSHHKQLHMAGQSKISSQRYERSIHVTKKRKSLSNLTSGPSSAIKKSRKSHNAIKKGQRITQPSQLKLVDTQKKQKRYSYK
jgi:nucleolar protein 12